MIDPFTAFAMAQGAVAGIKKRLPWGRTYTVFTRSSPVSMRRLTPFT